jgi:hypothetical protein
MIGPILAGFGGEEANLLRFGEALAQLIRQVSCR